MQKILKQSPIPFYLQVASAMRRNIETGQWVSGQKLPSLEQLSKEFEVALLTARQAVGLLVEEGLIWRRQGMGTFVSNNITDPRWLNLQTEWSNLKKMFVGVKQKKLQMKENVEAPSFDPSYGVSAKSYHYMKRLSTKGGKPFNVVDIYLDQEVYAIAPEMFLKNMVVYVIDQLPGIKVSKARQIMTINTADLESAQLLETTIGAPVAHVRRIICNEKDIVIYLGDVVYRGDAIKLDINLMKS
jgi:GntR family transcriptional regulator